MVSAANVTISNSTIGPCGGIGVSGERLSNLSVTGNRFVGPMTGGVYCDTCQTVKVVSNDFRDMRMGDSARGQFVQFNNVTGPGSAVQNNTGRNVVGSDPEDLVSMYQSSGTSASPIDIGWNCFSSPLGSYKSDSGSGILVGDGAGSYINVHDNVLVNPAQVGIGVAGGHHITVRDNKIFGARQPLGLYVCAP